MRGRRNIGLNRKPLFHATVVPTAPALHDHEDARASTDAFQRKALERYARLPLNLY